MTVFGLEPFAYLFCQTVPAIVFAEDDFTHRRSAVDKRGQAVIQRAKKNSSRWRPRPGCSTAATWNERGLKSSAISLQQSNGVGLAFHTFPPPFVLFCILITISTSCQTCSLLFRYLRRVRAMTSLQKALFHEWIWASVLPRSS